MALVQKTADHTLSVAHLYLKTIPAELNNLPTLLMIIRTLLVQSCPLKAVIYGQNLRGGGSIGRVGGWILCQVWGKSDYNATQQA